MKKQTKRKTPRTKRKPSWRLVAATASDKNTLRLYTYKCAKKKCGAVVRTYVWSSEINVATQTCTCGRSKSRWSAKRSPNIIHLCAGGKFILCSKPDAGTSARIRLIK